MKKLVYVAVALALTLCVAVAQEQPWFDMKNCAFCKEIDAQPGLMQHMTNEYHNIKGGYLSITHIDPEYQEAFKKAQAGMQKVVADMQSTGKMPPMCQHCTKYGEFLHAGAQEQYVHSAFGEIFMMTSSDTAMVTSLQAFSARCGQECEKMKAEMKAK